MALNIRRLGFEDPDFRRCFDIRLAVFVTEQNVPESEERDEHDAGAIHYLAEIDGHPAGTARVLLREPGARAKITRVAVLRAYRGQGIGAMLMRHIERHVPARQFMLDGQLQALPFYERLGYQAAGAVFMEAGIAHRHMVKERVEDFLKDRADR